MVGVPPRLRRVAAGCADRETVFRLIETYGGETAEPDPWVLQLEGFNDVAAGVQAVMGAERTAVLDAFNKSVEAHNTAYQRQHAAEVDRWRQEIESRYSDGNGLS